MIARARIQGWLRDMLFGLVLRGTTVLSPWRRLLLRQLSGGFSGLPMAMMFFGMTFFLFCILFSLQSLLNQSIHAGYVFSQSYILLVMALGMLRGLWLQRGPCLARELLLPVDRRDFVRDIIRSGACDMAFIALGHYAGLLVGFAVFSPQRLASWFMLPWFVLVQYIIGYYVMLWLISFRSILVFLGIIPAILLLTGLVVGALFAGPGFWTPAKVILCIVVTASVVAGFHRLTISRWCHLELG